MFFTPNCFSTSFTTQLPFKKSLISIALFSTMLGSGLNAQANEPTKPTLSSLEDEIRWIHEEQYVSTATRTSEKISKSGASVSIITREDLKRMGARNLMDALKRLPGFSVQETFIGIPSIEVRGALTSDSEKVLFMMDGHAVNNNLVNGGATWTYDSFSIEDIKQIEVVRGPGSALYGANAFVAVINIITETADDIKGLKLTAGTESDTTRNMNVQFAKKYDDIKFAANLNLHESDGTYQYVENDNVGGSGYTNDWQKRYDFSINAQTKHFEFFGRYIDRRNGPFIGIGNALNDESIQDYTEYFLDLRYQRNLTSDTNLSAKIYHDQFKTKNYWEILPEGNPPGFTDGLLGSPTVKNQKTGAELQLDYQLSSNNKVLTGLFFEHQAQFDVEHRTNFDPNTYASLGSYTNITETGNWNDSQNRDISALFVQDIWDITPDVRLIAGYRYDQYSDFGKSVNPRASVSWEFIEDYTLSAAYGKAFRAPNFAELYNINNPAIVGNTELEPEKIETYEVSLNGQLNKRNQFKITSFRNHINNLIEKDSSSVYQNTGKLNVNGVELEYSSRLIDGSSFDVNYTYQFAENENTDEIQHHIPMHKANAGFNYRYSQFIGAYLGLSYNGSLSKKGDDAYDEKSLREKTTLDAAINYSNQADTLELSASIYNLLNEKTYVPSSGLPTGSGDRYYAIPEQDRHIALKLSYKL